MLGKKTRQKNVERTVNCKFCSLFSSVHLGESRPEMRPSLKTDPSSPPSPINNTTSNPGFPVVSTDVSSGSTTGTCKRDDPHTAMTQQNVVILMYIGPVEVQCISISVYIRPLSRTGRCYERELCLHNPYTIILIPKQERDRFSFLPSQRRSSGLSAFDYHEYLDSIGVPRGIPSELKAVIRLG